MRWQFLLGSHLDHGLIRNRADQCQEAFQMPVGRWVKCWLVIHLASTFIWSPIECVLLSLHVGDNSNNFMARLSGGHFNELSAFGTVSKSRRKENLTQSNESLSMRERRMSGKQGGSPATLCLVFWGDSLAFPHGRASLWGPWRPKPSSHPNPGDI